METTTTAEWQQRPWGAFLAVYSDPDTTVKRLWVKPKASLSLQYHLNRDEFWTVTDLPSRKIQFIIDRKTLTPVEDVVYHISRGIQHRIVNDSTFAVEVLEVAKGRFDENDIVRLDDKYGRTS